MNRRTFLKYVAASVIIGVPKPAFPSIPLFMRRNPYLYEFDSLPENYKRNGPLIEYAERNMSNAFHATRKRLVNTYSWAVPTEDAVKSIAAFVGDDSIVDFGAGSGYWAYLLKDYDKTSVCIDNWSTGPKPDSFWHPVTTGSFELLPQHRSKTMMIVWPPRALPMAVDALRHWGGNKLVYVGEQMPRSTADPAFFSEIHQNWRLVNTVNIPQWFNRADSVYMLVKR